MLVDTAVAARARQGDDYSFAYNGNTQVAICDMERDATRVYSEYKAFGKAVNWRIYDENGANSGCSGSRYHGTGIYKHNTCEDRKLWPNPCRVSYHS